tara:strand:+ start:783 stop:1064 length:282 start_codon:yes stop_codon:yes gene_type:complete
MNKLIGIILGVGALAGAGYYFSKKKKNQSSKSTKSSVSKGNKVIADATPKSEKVKPIKKVKGTKRLTVNNCKAVKENRVVGGYKATLRKRKIK